ncbi:autotransporter outer membrane beta-barrel domain-containing protein [Polynucleobacter sp. 86C-FISCH]|uniref:autotransporter outer membrane beta-barrel domain-containing protein n=1 Tax=Polynucleobacter sp. 86C-FISCH TaxID=2689101 RepID=UPI001C0E5985|nr:autotransporter outer membrane beta-barrel domain-containing protein [Polynucleobacter sp. 86C-FISCH]MBU3595149.1 autotransporter outer membrane beta-barrel domain-containing protein [Polynucleobacter sp. 86C-FISCH]
MKLLNLKKIAFASVLVAGATTSVSVYAQTNLITSLTPSDGTASGLSVASAVSGFGPNATNSTTFVTNNFNIVSGQSYTLRFSLDRAIFTTDASGQNINFRPAPFTIIVGGFTTSAIAAGTSTYSLSAAAVSAMIGSNRSLRFALSNDASAFTISNILFTDGSGPAPTPSGPTAEEIAAAQAAIAAALLQASTQQSIVNTAQALQGTYALQNSVLANSFTYDCTLFDKNNICVSAGGRNTAVQAANGLNNTSALLIAAYRPITSVRIGAYADQNLSVNNGGSTVNLSNNTPLIGLFAAWNQRQDDTGTEVRGSIAYGQKDTTINRQVVGTSQAGTGSSTLISQGAQLTAKYGFGLGQSFVVSPYAGVRYSQNNMGGYTEGASAGVTAPLTFGAVNTNATTLLAGVGGSFRGIPKTNLFASAGIESDTNTAAGTVSGTSSTITGLTPVNFNANPVKNRPTATVGATYDVEKNQRLGVTGIYRQEAYQAVSTTTVMATYTVGF